MLIRFGPSSTITLASLRRSATVSLALLSAKVALVNVGSSLLALARICSCRSTAALSTRARAPRRRGDDHALETLMRERNGEFKCPQLAVPVPRLYAVDAYALEFARVLQGPLRKQMEAGTLPEVVLQQFIRHEVDLAALWPQSAQRPARRPGMRTVEAV